MGWPKLSCVYRADLRDSIVVSISACHADDPGSIPGRGVYLQIAREDVSIERVRMLENCSEYNRI